MTPEELREWGCRATEIKARQILFELAESRERLALICAVAIGYDGFNTVEGLKSLVDDMVDIAKNGVKWDK